ncbi:carotenoid oxygenase family protein [Tsukamurella sp. 8F]|uniref:carotenoid oxygenase family protein n=1 Tax=unclassified Tsukamurella TaxID=2633480 RepID=UPI0023B9B23E|nr:MULTISPECIES: carotenoid oxygenase family protein [unclassified Tsukamurella]MDF0529948.1 carotenoid oxygenase family protein [Tsukamurella sp. 8J]MDF0587280.1 carotenoid oxygenase family protein [Tsukamurella sp. 8F]
MRTIEASNEPTGHPFLQGNYAPVQEEVTATDLSVAGAIPPHLDGRYLRIGPNPVGTADPARYEWFMGSGMVHGIRISDGRAQWYRNRWVRSADVCRRLGEPRRRGPAGAGIDFASNTNVLAQAGRTLAIAEFGVSPYELTEDLDTVGPCDFGGTLRGGYSGHPKRDPETGELHAVSYSPMWGNLVRYTVTGVDGRVCRRVDIPLRRNVMIHDFSLTERYVVIYDLPVVMDLAVAGRSRLARRLGYELTDWVSRHPAPGPIISAVGRASGMMQPDIGLPYRWDPTHQAKLLVMPRDGGPTDVREFDIDPCFIYHTLNAHDDGVRITLELSRFPKAYDGDSNPMVGLPAFERWIVDLSAGTVRREGLDDRPQDFPRVDERTVGRAHRYGYTIGYGRREDALGAPEVLVKHDGDGATQVKHFGSDREPGEFVFVPNAPDSGEDDGVLMGFVYDRAEDRSSLQIVDAQTLDQVATVHLPARVPNGFHGNWISSEQS